MERSRGHLIIEQLRLHCECEKDETDLLYLYILLSPLLTALTKICSVICYPSTSSRKRFVLIVSYIENIY